RESLGLLPPHHFGRRKRIDADVEHAVERTLLAPFEVLLERGSFDELILELAKVVVGQREALSELALLPTCARLRVLDHQHVSRRSRAERADVTSSKQRVDEVGLDGCAGLLDLPLPDVVQVLD